MSSTVLVSQINTAVGYLRIQVGGNTGIIGVIGQGMIGTTNFSSCTFLGVVLNMAIVTGKITGLIGFGFNNTTSVQNCVLSGTLTTSTNTALTCYGSLAGIVTTFLFVL